MVRRVAMKWLIAFAAPATQSEKFAALAAAGIEVDKCLLGDG
jgi:hypothetical protein